jgi:predicted transcriptional regulator
MVQQHSQRLGGPIPKFGDYHIWKTLSCISECAPVGRKRLASLLNIGEGSIRTILNMLQEDGLVIINKNGVGLTQEGLDCWKAVRMEIAPLNVGDLTIGEVNCAVRVPGAARSVEYGCEERDTAIKVGAIGATTLIFTKGILIFPGSNYPVEPKTDRAVREAFDLSDDDVVIIGTAKTLEDAEKGAVVAGVNLLGGLRIHRELKEILSHRSTGSELLALAFAVHDLVGGLPVCAKSRDNLGIRIENGAVIDNAYTGAVLEEVINAGTTIRRVAISGPYKGIRVIVTPIELDNRVIAAIGVVDIRSMAGVNNLIRLRSDENDQ